MLDLTLGFSSDGFCGLHGQLFFENDDNVFLKISIIVFRKSSFLISTMWWCSILTQFLKIGAYMLILNWFDLKVSLLIKCTTMQHYPKATIATENIESKIDIHLWT